MKTSNFLIKWLFLILLFSVPAMVIPWSVLAQFPIRDTSKTVRSTPILDTRSVELEKKLSDDSRTLALMVQEWTPLIPQRSYFYKPKKKIGLEFQFFLGGDVPDKAMGIQSESQRSAVISSFHVIYKDYGVGSTPVYHRHEEGKNTIYQFTNISADVSYSSGWRRRTFGVSGLIDASMQTVGMGVVTSGGGSISRNEQEYETSSVSGQALFANFHLDLGFMNTLYGVRIVSYTYNDFTSKATGKKTNQIYKLRNWMWMFGLGVSM